MDARGRVESQQFLNFTEDRPYTVTGNHICPLSSCPFRDKGQLKADLYVTKTSILINH